VLFRQWYPEDVAVERATDLGLDIGKSGVIWRANILMGIARLSSAHELRMREYLGLSEEEMASAMARHPSDV
jgi:hypothetical protein